MNCLNPKLNWSNLFDGVDDLHIGPDSIVKLAELAGAPWNDKEKHTLGEKQKELLRVPERTLVLFAGARSGKSVIGACIALAQLMIPNSKIALVGESYNHCAKEFKYIWKGFFNLFPETAATRAACNITKSHYSMQLETAWGSSVEVISIKQGEGQGLLGDEYDLAVLCEASYVDPEVYTNKLDVRLRGRAKYKSNGFLRRTGRVLLLTSPKGKAGASYALYDSAMEKTNGDLSQLHLANDADWFESFYFAQLTNIELNPAFPIEAFESARKTLPRADFEEQFLGMAKSRTGNVYKSFNEEKHVIDKLPEGINQFKFGVGIDPGESNFGVVLVGMSPASKLYVLNERYFQDLNSIERCEEIKEMINETLGQFFVDPKDLIEHWVVDIHSQHKNDIENLLEVTLDCRKQELLGSLSHIDMRFANNEIYVFDECYHFLKEIKGYRYKYVKGSIRDEPTGSDHVLDAFRYLALIMLEGGAPEIEKPQKSFAEMIEESRKKQLSVDIKKDLETFQQRSLQQALRGIW